MIATLPNRADLDRALGDLRELLDRHDTIVSFNSSVIAMLAGYGKKLQGARRELNEALRALDLPRAERAIENLVDIRSRAQFADDEFRVLNHLQTVGGSMSQFLGENGNAKRVLLDACQFSLAKAEENYNEVRASEAARMGPSFDADDSPVTRRAKSLVTRRQHQLKRIMESPIADTFSNFSRQLLNE